MQLNPATGCGCCGGAPGIVCGSCTLPATNLTLTYFPGGGFTTTLVFDPALQTWTGSGVIPISGATVTWVMRCTVSATVPNNILVTETAAVGPTIVYTDDTAACGGLGQPACLDMTAFTCSPLLIDLTQHSTGVLIAEITL